MMIDCESSLMGLLGACSRALLRWALPAMIIIGSALLPAPAASAAQLSSVGPIRLTITDMAQAERLLGPGLVTTGYHPHGAMSWRLKNGGCLELGGWKYTKDGTIVDTVSWWSERCSAPRARMSLKFHGIGLGTPKATVMRVLGAGHSVENAYSRRCFLWQKREAKGLSLEVYADFKHDRVSFLAVSLWPDT